MDFLGKWTECDICGEPFKIVLNSEICLKCGQVRLNGKTITSALKVVDDYKRENESKISEYSKLLCTQQLASLSPEEQELAEFLGSITTIVGIISEGGVYTTKLKEPQKLYDLLLKLDSFAKKMSNQDK